MMDVNQAQYTRRGRIAGRPGIPDQVSSVSGYDGPPVNMTRTAPYACDSGIRAVSSPTSFRDAVARKVLYIVDV
jgi:hypothetical protein